jgi:hypothetical protein
MLKRGVKGCVSCPIIFRGPGSDFGPNKSVEHVSCCSEGALVLAGILQKQLDSRDLPKGVIFWFIVKRLQNLEKITRQNLKEGKMSL